MANYTAFVLPIGVVNITSGKTCYDWSIYDDFHQNGFIYLVGRFLMLDAHQDFEIGDTITLRNNDSQRKLKEAKVIDFCKCNKEDILAMLLKNGYDYYPKRAFQKGRFKAKLDTSYSIKGITN